MTLDNMLGRGLERAASGRNEITRYLTKIRRKIAPRKPFQVTGKRPGKTPPAAPASRPTKPRRRG